ncbi:uncharacterized protein [Apostichopus japonicus]|uniref:uncharacterized protein n=1 Tax=Stichopus japonicus TaxID=307972 RepID=UPI003AB423A5
MYSCYKCLKQFKDIQLLWKHLSLQHGINTKSRTKIICSQLTCKKIYYNGYTYKRHLLAEHALLANPREIEQEEPGPAVEQIPVIPDEHDMQQVQDINGEENDISDVEVDNPKTHVQITQEVESAAALYVASLKNTTLPSSTVQNILDTSRQFIRKILDTLGEVLDPILQDVANNVMPCDEKVECFKLVMNVVKDPFSSTGLLTQYQQRQYVIHTGAMIVPKQILLGKIYKEKLNRSTGRTEQKETEETFQYIPIAENLRLLLQQPGYMANILLAKQDCGEENIIQTYQDSSYFKDLDNQGMNIDLLLYNDDFETANPLGSKKGNQKVLGVYMSVISLPRKYQSKLENILLVAVAKSAFVSKYGINAILNPIIHDLEHFYTNGLQINVPGEFVGQIRPRLFQAVGDNLSLNTTLGFASSFSANYFCRFCKVHKNHTHRQVVENEDLLRTQENIEDDIQRRNVSETGLNRSSTLNDLSYFHVAYNASPDIMHDFLEGIVPIELKLILHEFIIMQNYFTLNDLNARIQAFSYGFTEQSNKPSPILASHLVKPFGASGQNASQMHCLAVYIPIMIGDKVPRDSQFWELYLLLLEIYKLVSAPSISIDGTFYLKSKIKEHHELFLRLFPEHHLIPKHHHLVHYPRSIRKLGPLSQFSNFRHEAKHKRLKKWAKLCNNYKNIAKTLAIKHQEAQAYSMLIKEDIDSKAIEVHDQNIVEVSSLENDDRICNLLHCTPETTFVVCGMVEVYGYNYRPNMMLLSQWIELPAFVMIQQIIQIGSRLHFLVQPWTTLEFENHFQAYIVSNDLARPLQLKEPDDICDYRPVHVLQSYCTSDKRFYIPTRYELA